MGSELHVFDKCSLEKSNRQKDSLAILKWTTKHLRNEQKTQIKMMQLEIENPRETHSLWRHQLLQAK